MTQVTGRFHEIDDDCEGGFRLFLQPDTNFRRQEWSRQNRENDWMFSLNDRTRVGDTLLISRRVTDVRLITSPVGPAGWHALIVI